MNQSEDQRLISLATSVGLRVLAGNDKLGTFYAHLTMDDGVGSCATRQSSLTSALRLALLGCFTRGLVNRETVPVAGSRTGPQLHALEPAQPATKTLSG